MQFCVILALLLLISWGHTELCLCGSFRGMLQVEQARKKSGHAEVQLEGRGTIAKGGRAMMARVGLEMSTTSSFADDYGAQNAPPRLPEARHGPVLFFGSPPRRAPSSPPAAPNSHPRKRKPPSRP